MLLNPYFANYMPRGAWPQGYVFDRATVPQTAARPAGGAYFEPRYYRRRRSRPPAPVARRARQAPPAAVPAVPVRDPVAPLWPQAPELPSVAQPRPIPAAIVVLAVPVPRAAGRAAPGAVAFVAFAPPPRLAVRAGAQAAPRAPRAAQGVAPWPLAARGVQDLTLEELALVLAEL